MSDRTIEIALLRVGDRPTNAATTIDIPESLKVQSDGDPLPGEGFGCFRILTPKDGDKRVVWNSRSIAEINDAKNVFNKLLKEGLKAFRVGTGGKADQAQEMTEFDPLAEEVVFLAVQMAAAG